MDAHPTFVELDDPARNDCVEENVVCSTCTNALAKSRLLNPSRVAKAQIYNANENQVPTLLLRKVSSFPHFLGFRKAAAKALYKCQMLQYEQEAWAHHKSPSELKRSSDSGCHLCALIWYKWKNEVDNGIRNKWRKEMEHGLTPRLEFANWPPFFICISAARPNGTKQEIGVKVTNYPLGHGYKDDAMTEEDRLQRVLEHSSGSIDLSTVKYNCSNLNNNNSEPSEVNADIQRLHYLAHTAKSTASDWTIGLAKFWLQSCINGHALCPKPSGHLPSRLVDLTELSRARVIETHDLRGVQYLTLSHCWGGANMLMLESSTADSLFSGVGLGTMPKTFRDAIHVTKRLGYDYLWIDSLCIMQDSAEDWLRESRTMHQIYRHSVCTIAALAAFDGQEGLFIKRNPLQYRQCDIFAITELPLRIQGEYIYGVRVAGRGHYSRSKHGNDGLKGSLLRLRQRGWVFQEDLLSPRTLYFGEDGIRWECLEMNRDEGHGPSGKCGCYYCDIGNRFGNRSLFKQHFAVLESKFSTINSIWEDYYPSFHRKWWSIVEQYSQLSLTIPSDKLVAINGPIRAIESRGSLTNLAGHWKEYLPFDLLWTAGTMEHGMGPSKCTRSGEHRAPSWSWASMDGPVHFLGLYNILEIDKEGKRFTVEIELDAKVVDIGIVPRDSGELLDGKQGGGSISLSAHMRKSTWGEGETVKREWSQRRCLMLMTFWKQDDYRQNLDEVWCVLIVRTQKKTYDPFVYDAGLVLIPDKTSAGFWSRIGIFLQSYEADKGEDPLVFFPRNGTISAKKVIQII